MVARFLVTTALEDTWPEDGVPILFLGEWCRLYERKFAWENRDAVVAPYHWDDRRKLHENYLYLQALYEKLLGELAEQLNALHHVDYSLRYWRIIVGPWLGYFIQMLFDRWSMLRQVMRDNEIAAVQVLRRSSGEGVPNDMAAFIDFFIGDQWNELIYGEILDWLDMPVEKIDASKQMVPKPSNRVGPMSPASRLKRVLAKVARSLSGALCRENEYFFIASYLRIPQDMLLQLKLGQLPKSWGPVKAPISQYDPAARQWQLHLNENSDEFLTLLCTLIPRHIPKTYLEGYGALVSLAKSLPWPGKPKAIFTSNSYSTDDVFKAWAALKVEAGAPLIIGQHGGNYGMALWGFTEEHQIAIADRFLTWGWATAESSNVKPIGNLKGFAKQITNNEEGIALLVEMVLPRYSYHMYSSPVAAGQWLNYFDEQCRFVQALPAELRAQLLVRLYSQDYGLSQRQRWQDRFPGISLDNGQQPMERLMGKARIFISTYNATTFLESLSMDFPTIMFWNPKHWELRGPASPYLEQLKSVGIYHETPESAARQMEAVWHDVAGWWQSPEVQAVRQAFCSRYACIPEQPLDVVATLFREIVQ